MAPVAGEAQQAGWSLRIDAAVDSTVRSSGDAGRIAQMFGLGDRRREVLYEAFDFSVAPGEIVAMVGPSGSGKSMLLRQVRRQVRGALWLRIDALSRSRRPAVEQLARAVGQKSGRRDADLRRRLTVLSRCGLAEAAALVTPTCRLSGGQLYRLALGEAMYRASARGREALVLCDEFAAVLDPVTARSLCRQVRKLIDAERSIALLVATPRPELLAHLRPDRVIAKPLGGRARLYDGADACAPAGDAEAFRDVSAAGWAIRRGRIGDYRRLARFHYCAGPPAAHKRVYAICPPANRREWGEPEIAAVLVVSPPLMNCRGRNAALPGRYTGPTRREGLAALNRDIEAISRVVVHPVYRGCGLAVRLVRHALATAQTPLVEALAVMGQLHPFFETAGMYSYGRFNGARPYVYYLGHRRPPIDRAGRAGE